MDKINRKEYKLFPMSNEKTPSADLTEENDSADQDPTAIRTEEISTSVKKVLGDSCHNRRNSTVQFNEDGDPFTNGCGGGDPGGWLPDPNNLDAH